MLLSNYFLPTLKNVAQDSGVLSYQLMVRAGMIRQITSGIYSWLPLGFKVLKNVEQIIREELDKAGAQELLLPCIQPASLWEKSGRLDIENDLGPEMLRMQDRNSQELVFSATAEELITSLVGNNSQSYKEFPKTLYQIGWKFRDEIRPRFGVMRSREFLMKDAYSFHLSKEDALNTFERMLATYMNIFKRLGLKAIPVAADSGAMGGDYSQEFHILSDTGESEIYYDEKLEEYLGSDQITLEGLSKYYACESDKHDTSLVPERKLKSRRGIEVSHLFYLGDKYTKTFDTKIQAQDGSIVSPHMGCYGIGVSRLVAAIIEAFHDEKGIKWPLSVAPFKVGVINLRTNDSSCAEACSNIYQKLKDRGIEVLYDDTSSSPGEKFANMDLIGLPFQIIIGPRGLKQNEIEIKERATDTKATLPLEQIEAYIVDKCKS